MRSSDHRINHRKWILWVTEVWFSAGWGTKEAENIFLTCGWEYRLECVGGLRSCEKFKVHFVFAIRHCLTPSHPPTHAWSISRVGCVFSFASLPKFECKFFCLNQLLIMYSFFLVFLDSVLSYWPLFVLLYLSFCVNKGQAACSAWHGSQLYVRSINFRVWVLLCPKVTLCLYKCILQLLMKLRQISSTFSLKKRNLS